MNVIFIRWGTDPLISIVMYWDKKDWTLRISWLNGNKIVWNTGLSWKYHGEDKTNFYIATDLTSLYVDVFRKGGCIELVPRSKPNWFAQTTTTGLDENGWPMMPSNAPTLSYKTFKLDLF